MANRAPRRYADQVLRDGTEAAQWRADAAAQLYLRPARHAGRYVWAVRGPRQIRAGLALSPDRRQPFAERDRAGSAGGVTHEDRGGMTGAKWRGVRRVCAEPLILSQTRFLHANRKPSSLENAFA